MLANSTCKSNCLTLTRSKCVIFVLRSFFCASKLLSSRRLDYFHFCFIREEEVFAMIHSIIKSDDSRPLNIRKSVSSLAMAITCRMEFGKRYSGKNLKGFNSMVKESLMLLSSFNIRDYLPFLGWMGLQGVNRQMKKLHKVSC